MEEDLISIVVPVYNAEKYIVEAIQTVKEQTYQNWEMILVDDGSTDQSRELIKQNLCDHMTLIALKKHAGTAVARNEGIKQAKGRYLSFLDADDLWDKEKQKKQLDFMKKNGYAFTYTAFQYIDENHKTRSKKIAVPEKLEYKEALKDTRILSIAVLLDLKQIPKETCMMINVMHEDVATWWKIMKRGYPAYGLNEVLVYYRRYPNSKTFSKLKSAKHRWEVYRKVEKLSILKSAYYFFYYVLYGIKKRIGKYAKITSVNSYEEFNQ